MIKRIAWTCGLASVVGMLAAAVIPASAARPVAIEKELLGVRVLQNYREVLVRYGAPTQIFRATETVVYREATSLNGSGTGGILGILDSTSGGGGGPAGPMMGGPGGPMMGGSAGGMMGAARRGGGKMGGMMGGDTAPGSSYPGMGGSAGPGAMGGMGGGAQGGDNPDATFAEAGGFTWVYLYPVKELAYEFHFNKDGRVERIAELGRGFGQHTSRGIGLGDTLEKVYSVYGWTDQIKDEGTGKFSLLYNDKYHAQFLILKNKVIGISVFLKENQYMRFEGGTGGGAGAPMMGGPGGPMMGGPAGAMMGGGPRAGGAMTGAARRGAGGGGRGGAAMGSKD
jgi:hypothetical protein